MLVVSDQEGYQQHEQHLEHRAHGSEAQADGVSELTEEELVGMGGDLVGRAGEINAESEELDR